MKPMNRVKSTGAWETPIYFRIFKAPPFITEVAGVGNALQGTKKSLSRDLLCHIWPSLFLPEILQVDNSRLSCTFSSFCVPVFKHKHP